MVNIYSGQNLIVNVKDVCTSTLNHDISGYNLIVNIKDVCTSILNTSGFYISRQSGGTVDY